MVFAGGSENNHLLEIAVADALFKDAAFIDPLARLVLNILRIFLEHDALTRAEQPRIDLVTEPLERLKRHGILIDGEGEVDDGETKNLPHIFSRTVIGPMFFEFIQRKVDDGFGEGNFKALFKSIEAQ